MAIDIKISKERRNKISPLLFGNFIEHLQNCIIGGIYDSGNPSSYTKEVYRTYYAQSIAHNVVLFNNMGQDSRDNLKDHARVKGRLLNFKADENFKYLLADCTGPMGRYFRKHHRHFLWIENAILIYDDIECYEKGEVNFLMHEDESSFKMLTDCECTVREGYKDKSDEINCTYKSYNLKTDEAGHAKFVSLIALDESKEISVSETAEYIKICYGESIYYINKRSDGKVMHRNCFVIVDGILTDATVLTDKGGKISVVNGSIVRKNGESLLDEFSRINGFIN